MAAQQYGLPILITENGSPGSEGYPPQEDFMVRNLSWIARAIEAGVPVEGYFYWSLMDNYEWNHGMSLDFGLYAVRPDDPIKLRTPRVAASVYGQIAASRGISEELANQYPICTDEDRDGHCPPEDCEDGNAAINPGATEVCGNGIDDNCNGSIDEGCGYSAVANTEAAVFGSNSVRTSGVFNELALVVFPACVIVFMRMMRRKK
jgi:hypothetical protein